MHVVFFFVFLSVVLAGCTGTRTAVVYDPSRSHRLSIVGSGTCPDRDVVVIVDGKEHRFLDGRKSLQFTIPEGEHTIVHWVGSYLMQQWKAYPVVTNTVLYLACSRRGVTEDSPPSK